MYDKGLDWLKGYLAVRVSGKRLERLLNLAVGQGMKLWDIRRFDQENGRFFIRLEDYFRLRPLLRKTGCRVRIVRRVGLPFLLHKMKKRSTFFTGAAFFVLALILFSHMVWHVEVVGNEEIPEENVLEAAQKIGIKKGTFTFRLPSAETVQDRLLTDLPRATWIGFEVKGTKAIIRVVEKTVPEKTEELNPRHLIASKKAIIQKLLVEQGRPVVRVNQWVNKGQILVSGFMGNEQNYKVVPAKGKVFGEVWYETEVTVPLMQRPSKYTGEQISRYSLLFGNYAIRLTGYGELPFQIFETHTEKQYLSVGRYRLPLGWKKEDFFEATVDGEKLTEEQATQLAIKIARQDVLSHAEEGRIKREKVLHRKLDNDKVYIKIHFAIIEEIGMEQAIVDAPLPQEPTSTR